MNSTDISHIICKNEILKKRTVCSSVKFLFEDFECDVLSFSKHRILTEYEVKISRNDFFRDFEKKKHKFYLMGISCPNFLYYVVPENMVSPDDIPHSEYGLMYVSEKGKLTLVKPAKPLTKNKQSEYTILNKFVSLYQERNYFDGRTLYTTKRNNERIVS